MTDALTRLQLLRRAAAGSALLTLPGVLAACGGSAQIRGHDLGRRQDAREDAAVLQLDALHGHEQQEEQLSFACEFQKKYGSTSLHEDINDNASYFGKIQGRSRAANRSTATSSS